MSSAGARSSRCRQHHCARCAARLQRVLAVAVRRGKVNHNVAKDAEITSKAPAPKRHALQPDDARTLLAALRSEPNGALFGVSLRIGLRPGEAAALHWDDVNLDRGIVHVRRGVRLARGRPEVVPILKTVGSARDIEMPTELIAWLGDHRRDQVAERLAAKSWQDDRLVFASPIGRVLSPPNMRRHLADICERANVPVILPNELRHSCASLLSDEGVPNELIADLLGHTSTRMVEATYPHRLRPVVDVAARSTWATVVEVGHPKPGHPGGYPRMPMNDIRWRDQAACRGWPIDWWYPRSGDPITAPGGDDPVPIMPGVRVLLGRCIAFRGGRSPELRNPGALGEGTHRATESSVRRGCRRRARCVMASRVPFPRPRSW